MVLPSAVSDGANSCISVLMFPGIGLTFTSGTAYKLKQQRNTKIQLDIFR